MADALSRTSRGELNVSISEWKLKDALRDFDLWIGEGESRPCIFNLVAQSSTIASTKDRDVAAKRQ